MKSELTKLFSRAAAMLLMMLLTTATAWAETKSVKYIDADGNEKSVEATVLTGGGTTTLGAGWYVATGKVSYTGTVKFSGVVHLILADGCRMNVGTSESRITGPGIDISPNQTLTLTIYGQSAGSGSLSVYTTGAASDDPSGIWATTLTFNGGHVTADTNGEITYSIGAMTDLTINGGTVTATATGSDTYAIYAYKNFIIGGGTVTASSYSIYGTFSIAPGLVYTDGSDTYSGTLYDKNTPDNGMFATLDDLNDALGGQTLTPVGFKIDVITYVWTSETTVKVAEYNGNASSLTIPASVEHNGVMYNVTEIGDEAFKDNHDLTSIDISHCAITTIGARAFTGCTNLSEITLPASVKTIDEEAFRGTDLEEITIPFGATTIGSRAFADCAALTTVTIPSSVTSIGDDVFEGCENLIIYVPADMVSYYSNKWPDYTIRRGSFSYIAADGTKQDCAEFTVLNAGSSTTLEEGWYVVTEDIKIFSGISINGDVNLILADGATMTVNGSTAISLSGGDLTIYGQAKGTGTLIANGIKCGIIYSDNGNLTINGGNVTATGSDYGIFVNNLTLNGGNVIATSNSKGIKASAITLAGGSVTASSYDTDTKKITISGGLKYTDGIKTFDKGFIENPDAGTTYQPEWEGSGTSADDPYLIKTPADLDLLAKRVNNLIGEYSSGYFQLANDIAYAPDVLTIDNDGDGTDDSNFTAIGRRYDDELKGFCGHFDGNNKTISGIRIYKKENNHSDQYQGIFGVIGIINDVVSIQAEVKNIILADTRITAYSHTGGIVGHISCGTVENCHVLSDVTIHAIVEGAGDIGSIAGFNNRNCTVTGCTSAASIICDGTGTDCRYYGGIVGFNCGSVSNCLYLGNTLGGTKEVGAIVGKNQGGSVSNSYFTSTTITGKNGSGDALSNVNSAVGLNSGTATTTSSGLARTITLGESITLDATPTAYGPLTAYGGFALSHNDGTATTLYSVAGNAVALDYTGTDVPVGYRPSYSYNDGSDDHAVDGTKFTMPAANVTVSASTATADLRSTGQAVSVSYIGANGEPATVKVTALDGYEPVEGPQDYQYFYIYGGHFVGKDISYSDKRIDAGNGNLILILGDGATMTVNVTNDNGIDIENDIDIYGQTAGTGTLDVTSTSGDAIWVGQSVKIYGGMVNATGGQYGIYAYNITLAGGTVKASSYSIDGTFSIAPGLVYTDGQGHSYSGTLYDATNTANGQFASLEALNDALAGQTLSPNGYVLTANLAKGKYWTTFYCGDASYKIDDEEDACAYTAEYDDTNSQLTLHELGKDIPKDEAVIIVGADNSIRITKVNDPDLVVPANDLEGVDVRTETSTLGDGTFYVMGKVGDDFGFFQYTAQYMPARKAYLLVSGSEAPGLTMVFDETSSLNEELRMKNEEFATATGWYTLSGTRLSAKPTQKGIYVVNGKKVVIK